jgi:hypothetical protein
VILAFSILSIATSKTDKTKENHRVAEDTKSVNGIEDVMVAIKLLQIQHQEWRSDNQAILKKVDILQTGSHEQNDNSYKEFPYISVIVLLVGCANLLRFILIEFRNYSSKAASIRDSTEGIPVGEFLQYRLDFYFSSSRWAKPLLLLTLTFILILQSTIVLMMLAGDDLGGAMWKAWTYVADPGSTNPPNAPFAVLWSPNFL